MGTISDPLHEHGTLSQMDLQNPALRGIRIVVPDRHVELASA